MTKTGIITLGEALIDFVPLDEENMQYQKSPGGAPANVAAGLSRLGAEVHFIGKVGRDSLGRFLTETLAAYGVNVTRMISSAEARTGFTLVTNDKHGDRDFEFFIQPSADCFLTAEEIDPKLFKTKKILHIGSISLINEPARSATWHAIRLAKAEGMLLSYDPNLRIDLWENKTAAKQTMMSVLPYADIVKLSYDELQFLMEDTSEAAIQELAKKYSIPLVFATNGKEGCTSYCPDGILHVPAVQTKAVDTTGAGDAFVSAVLYKIDQANKSLEEWTMQELQQITNFASLASSITVGTRGAMSALPTMEMIQNMDTVRLLDGY